MAASKVRPLSRNLPSVSIAKRRDSHGDLLAQVEDMSSGRPACQPQVNAPT
jgi:hypothetical protein